MMAETVISIEDIGGADLPLDRIPKQHPQSDEHNCGRNLKSFQMYLNELKSVSKKYQKSLTIVRNKYKKIFGYVSYRVMT